LGFHFLLYLFKESISNCIFHLVFEFIAGTTLHFTNNTLILLFLSHRLFIKVDALEPFKRKNFDEYTPEQFSCSKSQRNTISPHFKRICLCNSSTNFNHRHLDNESWNCYGNKQPISADSFKDIERASQQSSIELIENLHEYENLENICHMKEFFCSCSLISTPWNKEVICSILSYLKSIWVCIFCQVIIANIFIQKCLICIFVAFFFCHFLWKVLV